jgi:hypothetical protein
MRVDPESYEFGAPVSAYRALAMRSNLQFLIDSFPQHRINLVAGSTVFESLPDTYFVSRVGAGEFTYKWAQEFEWTWLRGDYPTGLDIVVAAKVGAEGVDDLTAVARIVPVFAPYYDPTYPAIWTATDVTTGANTTVVIEEQIFPEVAPVNQSDQVVVHGVEEDGFFVAPRTFNARLEIELTIPADDTGFLTEVLVREFACQS